MSLTSGVVNIAEFISVEYADVDVALSTVPTILKKIDSTYLKQGGFKLEFGESSTTPYYTEDSQQYGDTKTPAAKSASLDLATAPAVMIADFSDAVFISGANSALVVTGGTTTAPRVMKNHSFIVGAFGYVSGDAVAVTAIDKTNVAYDTITFSAACTGAAAGAEILEAVAAGASPVRKPFTEDELAYGTGKESAANKYLKIKGKNTNGKTIIVEIYNASVTESWSGANGKSVEPAPVVLKFSINKNMGIGKSYSVKPTI